MSHRNLCQTASELLGACYSSMRHTAPVEQFCHPLAIERLHGLRFSEQVRRKAFEIPHLRHKRRWVALRRDWPAAFKCLRACVNALRGLALSHSSNQGGMHMLSELNPPFELILVATGAWVRGHRSSDLGGSRVACRG